MPLEFMIYTDEADRKRQIRKREAVKVISREKSSPERLAEIAREKRLLIELGIIDPGTGKYAA